MFALRSQLHGGWELPLHMPQAQHKPCGARHWQGRLLPQLLAMSRRVRVTILVGCGTLGLNTLALDAVLYIFSLPSRAGLV